MLFDDEITEFIDYIIIGRHDGIQKERQVRNGTE